MIALADCAITVTNARESARWWNENLGFAVHTVGNGTHAVMVAPPGDSFVLHLCEGYAPIEPGNTGVAFVTDAIEPLVRRMQAGGVEFPTPLKKGPGGSMAMFADPDGNVFWLFEMSTAFIRRERRRIAKEAPAPRRRSPARVATPRTRARP